MCSTTKEDLEKRGYAFEVSPTSYAVSYKHTLLISVGAIAPPSHWKINKRMFQLNMSAALIYARKHEAEMMQSLVLS